MFFPIELLFNERNNWFSTHRSSIPYTNVIYSPFNTEYTSSDSLPSHSICMCFMLGPEWICMAKTKFQQDKGSLEIWTETDKEEAFIYLSAAYRSVGGMEAVWAGRSHHISLSSVILCDTMLLNSIFCPFFSLCVGLYCYAAAIFLLEGPVAMVKNLSCSIRSPFDSHSKPSD